MSDSNYVRVDLHETPACRPRVKLWITTTVFVCGILAAAALASGYHKSKPSTLNLATSKVSFLNQSVASQIDGDLMSPESGFAMDELMELAGLSVASAIAKEYPPDTHPRVLVLIGPGGNGGDGLVTTRHLHHFGYQPKIVYPKMDIFMRHDIYKRHILQLGQLGVPVTSEWGAELAQDVDLIVDSIFGYSFRGWRGGGRDAPYDEIVNFLATEDGGTNPIPVISVDTPSGWDVDSGPPDGLALRPDMLVSLTAPKQCAASFKGYHYVGGRFVPPTIIAKYGLELPTYPGVEQCVKL